MRAPRASRTVLAAAVVASAAHAGTARADDARNETTEAAKPPLVQVLFPNATASSSPADVPRDEPPKPAPPPKKPLPPIRLSAGGGVVAAPLGALATGALVFDAPVAPRVALRLWGDVPIASKRLESAGGVSEASLWMGGVGISAVVNDVDAPVLVRLHGGWGATVLHVRGVEVTDRTSGLKLLDEPQDLFTLLGQTGIDLSWRIAGRFSAVAGGRVGVTLTRLVVDHDGAYRGGEAGAFGPAFAVADVRLEVHL